MVKFKREHACVARPELRINPKPRFKRKLAVIQAKILVNLISITCLLTGKLLIAAATTTTTTTVTANHNTETTSPTDTTIRDSSTSYNEDENRHEKELQLLQVAELMNQSSNQLSSLKDSNYTEKLASNVNSESPVAEQSEAALDEIGMHDILAYDESVFSSNQIKLPSAGEKEDLRLNRPNHSLVSNSSNNSLDSLKEISAKKYLSNATESTPTTTTISPRTNSSVSKKLLPNSSHPNKKQQHKLDSLDVITVSAGTAQQDPVQNATESNIPLVFSPQRNSTHSSNKDNLELLQNKPQAIVDEKRPSNRLSNNELSHQTTTTKEAQASGDFTPENLHDHVDESDKLPGQVAIQRWRLKQRQQHQIKQPTEPPLPNVDSSGWLPSLPEKPQRAANDLIGVHDEDNRNDDQYNGQNWLEMRPPKVELISSGMPTKQASRRVVVSSSGIVAGTRVSQATSGISLLSENKHRYFGQPTTTTANFQQSLLRAKHLPTANVAGAASRPEEHQRLLSELSNPSPVLLGGETMATTHQDGGDYAAAHDNHQAPPTFLIPNADSFALRHPQQHQLELQKQKQQQQRANVRQAPFVSTLRVKSFGLLPRLAAKLFSSTRGGGDSSSFSDDTSKQAARLEMLNPQQQLAFQLATNLDAPLTLQKLTDATHQKSHKLSKTPSKLFPAKSSSLVKSLFARDQLLQQSSVTKDFTVPAFASVARLRKLPTTKVPSSNGAQIDITSPRAESQLVLMNGQVYSVLRAPNPALTYSPLPLGRGGRLNGNSFRGSIFDHQTSDTREFPVFEAMSMQHMLAAGSSGAQTAPSFPSISQVSPLQLPSGQTAIRCDRPKHLIQADRTVVNHILQSQQNFVIARVPIKKFTRPVAAATTTSENYGYQQQQNNNNNVGQHLYQMSPPQAISGAFEGSYVQQPLALNPSTNYAFATNQAPVFQDSSPPSTTSIEVSIPRHSIWSSLANLVSSFRGHHNHHSAQVVSPTSLSQVLAASELAAASNAGGLVSGSASVPAAVFIDGPLILASAKRRQSYLERLDRMRRRNSRQLSSIEQSPWQTRLSNGPSDASWSESKRRLLVVHGGQFLTSNNLFAAPTPPAVDHANYAASIIRSQFSDPLTSSASGEHNLDPMRRLLMLKTATDNEVCSPIGQVGTKIKYSCVPNYCVALALANNSQTGASHPVEQSMQAYGQQPQQRPQLIYTTNSANNGPINYDGGHRSQLAQSSMSVQHNRSVDPSEHLQVQQFDDTPATPAQQPKLAYHQSQQHQPLVTYTHINAYDPPLLSKLVQPQHQQFVSSSQTLEALANNEATFGSDELSTEMPLDAASYAALNMLNGDPFMTNSPSPLLATSFQAQASNLPFVGQQQQPQLVYMNYDSGGPAYPNGPMVHRQHQNRQASASNIGQPLNRQQPLQPTVRPSVTFGSAYITTSPVPFYEQKRPLLSMNQLLPTTSASFGEQAGSRIKSHGSQNAPRETRTRQQEQSEEQADNFGPNSLTASLEPNEFLSAVDEKLEKPLSGSSGRRTSQFQRQRQQHQHRGKRRNRQQPTASTNQTIEKARSSASTTEQNSATSIDGTPRVQHQTKSPPHGEQSTVELANQAGAESGNNSRSNNEARYVNSGKQEHRLSQAQSPNETAVSAVGSGGEGTDDGDDDYETATLDYDQSDYEPEVPSSQQQQQQQQQPGLKPRSRPLQPAASPPIGQFTENRQSAGREGKKTRRDNKVASNVPALPIIPTTGTTTSGPLRFGQRQSTPLPPPEKNVGADINEDLTQPAGSMDEELYEPNIGDGNSSSNTTECNCAKPAGVDGRDEQFHYERIGRYPLDQSANDRRRTSTLAPATLLQRTQPPTTTTTASRPNFYRQTNDGILATTPTAIGLAKDRRQVTSGGSSSIDATPSNALRLNNTKRSYNLRNTTYKNLLLGGNNSNYNNSGHMLLANNTFQPAVGTLLPQRHQQPTTAYMVNSVDAQVALPEQHSNADLSTTRATVASLLSENDNQIWPQLNYTIRTANVSGTIGTESSVPSVVSGEEDGSKYNQHPQTYFDDSVTSGAEPLTRHYTSAPNVAPEVRVLVSPISSPFVGSQLNSPQSTLGRGELNNEEDKLGARVQQQQPRQQAPLGSVPTLLPSKTGDGATLVAFNTPKRPQTWPRTSTEKTSRPATLTTATTEANTIASQQQPPSTSSTPNSSASPVAAAFTPSSVNDIVAQARREESLRALSANGTGSLAPPDARGSQGASAAQQTRQPVSAAVNQRQSISTPSSVDFGEDETTDGDSGEEEEEEEDDDKDITPHQYQIQVRWRNTSSVEGGQHAPAFPVDTNLDKAESSIAAGGRRLSEGSGAAIDELSSFAAAPLGARDAKSLKPGGEFELDRMKERVRDKLFEHREEEHWHEKSWLKGRGKRRRLVNGKWTLEPLPSKKIASGLDYGPHARERETPIKGQLANDPSEEETERHFAIPTANFRQSPKFVDWILRDVNMNEEPGEPTKITTPLRDNDAIAASSMAKPTSLALQTANAESGQESEKITTATTEATITQMDASSPPLTTEAIKTTNNDTRLTASVASWSQKQNSD